MKPQTDPLPEDLIQTLRLFSFYLGNGSLDRSVLPNDYRTSILQNGSELEQIYTIFLRNLRIGSDGKVEGVEHAQRRAAQWIRCYVDPSYVIDPPLTAEEVELGEP